MVTDVAEQELNKEPAARARRLLRSADRATLSTLLADDRTPYGSFVLISTDHAGHPILLLSDLAQHTKNLGVDSAASVLIDGTAGLVDPLSGPRATIMGRIEPCAEEAIQARFLARHPKAADYAGFEDFNTYRLVVGQVHLVAGFGAIDRIPASEFLFDNSAASALADSEQDIVNHMNNDHTEALQRYAAVLLGRRGTGWLMTGIDPEGIDLRHGGEIARLTFPEPVLDPDSARVALAALARRARAESIA